MRTHLIAAACSLVLLNLVLIAPAAAQSRMKGCADEWKAMKAASQTAGKTYRAFQKECMGRQSAAATASPGQPAVAGAGRSAKRARTAKSGKAGGGRQAMLARQRACAAEWKATKAQAAAGMTWPKFWERLQQAQAGRRNVIRRPSRFAHRHKPANRITQRTPQWDGGLACRGEIGKS